MSGKNIIVVVLCLAILCLPFESCGPSKEDLAKQKERYKILKETLKERQGSFTDKQDGKVYKTIKIGNQTWMAENLAATRYSDGAVIPNVTDNASWMKQTTGALCWYDNDSVKNKGTYGALYNGYAVTSGKLCPAGWHVPSDEDWKTLELYLGMSQAEADVTGNRGTDQGNLLKEPGNTHWSSASEGNNLSGFSALPGGYRNSYDGKFDYQWILGNWWTSTEEKSAFVWYHSLGNNNSKVYRTCYYKNYGFSVRCLKDN